MLLDIGSYLKDSSSEFLARMDQEIEMSGTGTNHKDGVKVNYNYKEQGLAISHRLCEKNSQFTNRPIGCVVRNDVVFKGRNLTLDEIYPKRRCKAFNMTIPCPEPDIALKAVMIGIFLVGL